MSRFFNQSKPRIVRGAMPSLPGRWGNPRCASECAPCEFYGPFLMSSFVLLDLWGVLLWTRRYLATLTMTVDDKTETKTLDGKTEMTRQTKTMDDKMGTNTVDLN